jgi:sterol desaturase/sphingolipid hydroxylase (fatty acid hydroxylase superfamily)
MSVPEYVMSVGVPTIISFCICHLQFTIFQFHLVMSLKGAAEIAGHSGLSGAHFYSSPMLPFKLPISLTCEEHTLHHSRNVVNFSKRFILWDLVFGTHDSPEGIAKKRFDRRVNTRFQVLGLGRRLSQSMHVANKPLRRETVLNPVGLDSHRERVAANKKKINAGTLRRSSF